MPDYTQPYFVGTPDSTGRTYFTTKNGRRGKFIGVSAFGYLRLLEEKPELETTEGILELPPQHDAFEQLQGRVQYLHGKLEEHIEKPKIKRSYKHYK